MNFKKQEIITLFLLISLSVLTNCSSRPKNTIQYEYQYTKRYCDKQDKILRTDDSIQLTFQRARNKLYSIYNSALRKDPTLSGEVLATFKISASGFVDNVTVESKEITDLPFINKITGFLQSLDFGCSTKEMTISYPLVFIPQ